MRQRIRIEISANRETALPAKNRTMTTLANYTIGFMAGGLATAVIIIYGFKKD